MKRSVAVAIPRFDGLPGIAKNLEAGGFHRAWATELVGRDAVVRALTMADAAPSLAVGTGIAYAFTRHPLAMAAAAVEAGAASGGRFTLGVGLGTGHVRSQFGASFDSPTARFGEYLDVIRTALDSDGSLSYRGRHYTVDVPGFRFGHARAVVDGARLYASALGPVTLRAVARTCDGVALHPFGHVDPYLDDVVVPELAAAAAASGRPTPAIATWIVCCALDDGGRARDLARAQIALYAAQPTFTKYFERTAWARHAARIRSTADLAAGVRPWLEIGRANVPDDMLDGIAIAGSPDEVAERLSAKSAELERRGVDEMTLQLPGIALPPDEGPQALIELASAAARRPGERA